MMISHHFRVVVLAGLLVSLAGCNTDDELAQQRLNILNSERVSLEVLKKDLGVQVEGGIPVFEGLGTVSIFLSKNLINSISTRQ